MTYIVEEQPTYSDYGSRYKSVYLQHICDRLRKEEVLTFLREDVLQRCTVEVPVKYKDDEGNEVSETQKLDVRYIQRDDKLYSEIEVPEWIEDQLTKQKVEDMLNAAHAQANKQIEEYRKFVKYMGVYDKLNKS